MCPQDQSKSSLELTMLLPRADVCPFSFLYVFFLAIDACFRLKRHLISSVLKDPSLASGWAYMVETLSYRDYLLTVTDQKEVRYLFILQGCISDSGVDEYLQWFGGTRSREHQICARVRRDGCGYGCLCAA
jgi:hypothetical protein